MRSLKKVTKLLCISLSLGDECSSCLVTHVFYCQSRHRLQFHDPLYQSDFGERASIGRLVEVKQFSYHCLYSCRQFTAVTSKQEDILRNLLF
jgi:hypothetical protein